MEIVFVEETEWKERERERERKQLASVPRDKQFDLLFSPLFRVLKIFWRANAVGRSSKRVGTERRFLTDLAGR